jgi:hypothetical protein
VEFAQAADRARTESGRVYVLGRQICSRDLDEEGRVALRLLLADDMSGYPGRDDDVAWLTSPKMARHLGVGPPPRGAYVAVEQFIERHRKAHLLLRGGQPLDWRLNNDFTFEEG